MATIKNPKAPKKTATAKAVEGRDENFDMAQHVASKPVKIWLFWEDVPTDHAVLEGIDSGDVLDVTPAYLDPDSGVKFNLPPEVYQTVSFANKELTLIADNGNEHTVPAMSAKEKVSKVALAVQIMGPVEFLHRYGKNEFILRQCSKMDRSSLLKILRQMRIVQYFIEGWPERGEGFNRAERHPASEEDLQKLEGKFNKKKAA